MQTLVPQSNPLAGIHYANNVIQISSRDMEDVSVIGSVRIRMCDEE